MDKKEAITINNFQKTHQEKLKDLDKTLEFFRDLVKKELVKACSTSYLAYKEMKKITLDDNNLNLENSGEEKQDITEKKKKKAENENGAANFIKYAMPYAQDATRR